MKKILKTVSTKLIHCHPYAIDAWQFSGDKEYQYRVESLGHDFISMMQALDPLNVVKGDGGSFLFFAGWTWFSLAQKAEQEKVSVVVYDELPDDFVSTSAWGYLLSEEFRAGHRKNNLAYMSNLLGKVPRHLTRGIYERYESRSFEQLSGETHAAVKNQRKRYRDSCTQSGESIIDQILPGN
jgi:hypothetical protein